MVQTITNQQKQVRVREERDPSKWIEFVIKKVPFSHSLLVLMPGWEKQFIWRPCARPTSCWCGRTCASATGVPRTGTARDGGTAAFHVCKKTRNKLDDLNLFNDVKTALKNIIHLIIYNNSSRSINSWKTTLTFISKFVKSLIDVKITTFNGGVTTKNIAMLRW